ncbi:hypothetical protein AB837_00004 [bacterium AB1]|nr:hypothetical protein AB837_00004 [bacterium AB1]
MNIIENIFQPFFDLNKKILQNIDEYNGNEALIFLADNLNNKEVQNYILNEIGNYFQQLFDLLQEFKQSSYNTNIYDKKTKSEIILSSGFLFIGLQAFFYKLEKNDKNIQVYKIAYDKAKKNSDNILNKIIILTYDHYMAHSSYICKKKYFKT